MTSRAGRGTSSACSVSEYDDSGGIQIAVGDEDFIPELEPARQPSCLGFEYLDINEARQRPVSPAVQLP